MNEQDREVLQEGFEYLLILSEKTGQINEHIAKISQLLVDQGETLKKFVEFIIPPEIIATLEKEKQKQEAQNN